MENLKNLKVGQQVNTKSGKAVVHSFTTLGTRRGDIRSQVRESAVELPILKGIDFIGYVNIVPNSVDFTYGHEAKSEFIN